MLHLKYMIAPHGFLSFQIAHRKILSNNSATTTRVVFILKISKQNHKITTKNDANSRAYATAQLPCKSVPLLHYYGPCRLQPHRECTTEQCFPVPVKYSYTTNYNAGIGFSHHKYNNTRWLLQLDDVSSTPVKKYILLKNCLQNRYTVIRLCSCYIRSINVFW
jgi:hypothetical protein